MSRVPQAVVFAAMSAVLFVSAASVAAAQTSMPPNQTTSFKDTSMLKPPTGAKVAILVWEDLECPACSRAFPIVHEAINHYKIPLVERDFPLDMHVWSKDAALYARYINDKIAPVMATEYRRQVFASQFRISSKGDLVKFTQTFMSAKGHQMPFVVDPTGELQREITADKALGDKLGVGETPTILVVTKNHWIQVKDVMQLYAAIDQAEAEAAHDSPTMAAKKK